MKYTKNVSNTAVIDRTLPLCCHLLGYFTLNTRHFLVTVYAETLCASTVS